MTRSGPRSSRFGGKSPPPTRFNKFDLDGVIANFDHVARGELGADHGGASWFDGLTNELIRAAADFLAESPDPKLEVRLDG